jgi:MoaA/NifB/PqqE/SkfB family radical SAM enzyme
MADLSAFNSAYFNYKFRKMFIFLLLFNKNSLTNIVFLLRVLFYQKKAKKIRVHNKINGINVPPIIVLSITRQCNLNCKGCYYKAQHRTPEKEMSTEKIISVFKEAENLGISLAIILGGEPFTRKDFFYIASSMKNIIFATFTNGTLIDDEMIKTLKKHKNIVPFISNEGYEPETDGRRGPGVYSHFRELAKKFKENHIIFGVSFTVTSNNFDIVNNEDFIKDLIKSGSTIFFYMDYRPVDGISSHLMLNNDQMKVLEDYIDTFRLKYNALYFSPVAERRYGGCFGAGKALIHVNFDGNVEPCPFAPVSDMNLNNVSLQEALNSDVFHIIREHHNELEHSHNGGCTLWENREWLHNLKS